MYAFDHAFDPREMTGPAYSSKERSRRNTWPDHGSLGPPHEQADRRGPVASDVVSTGRKWLESRPATSKRTDHSGATCVPDPESRDGTGTATKRRRRPFGSRSIDSVPAALDGGSFCTLPAVAAVDVRGASESWLCRYQNERGDGEMDSNCVHLTATVLDFPRTPSSRPMPR